MASLARDPARRERREDSGIYLVIPLAFLPFHFFFYVIAILTVFSFAIIAAEKALAREASAEERRDPLLPPSSREALACNELSCGLQLACLKFSK